MEETLSMIADVTHSVDAIAEQVHESTPKVEYSGIQWSCTVLKDESEQIQEKLEYRKRLLNRYISVQPVMSIGAVEDLPSTRSSTRTPNGSDIRWDWDIPYSVPFPLLADDNCLKGINETRDVRVYCCTWNMMGKTADSVDIEFIPKNVYHIYVVGTQECERTIAQSAWKTSRKSWDAKLLSHLGKNYTKLRSHTLQAIHAVVFVRQELLSIITEIGSSCVATGYKDTLGNKGGVGISFNLGKTSFLFVTSHFEAHQSAIQARNDNFHRIDSQLVLPPGFKTMTKTMITKHARNANEKNLSISRSGSGLSRQNSDNDGDDCDESELFSDTFGASGYDAIPADLPRARASLRFDRVFWLGDLNYRLNLSREKVDQYLKMKTQESRRLLVEEDQLRIELARGSVFRGYEEGKLAFRPTYKYNLDSNKYDTSKKKRIPSWTDRILYRTSTPSTISLIQYASIDSVRLSDHRPVVGSYTVKVEGCDNATIVGTLSHEAGLSHSQVCSVM